MKLRLRLSFSRAAPAAHMQCEVTRLAETVAPIDRLRVRYQRHSGHDCHEAARQKMTLSDTLRTPITALRKVHIAERALWRPLPHVCLLPISAAPGGPGWS